MFELKLSGIQIDSIFLKIYHRKLIRKLQILKPAQIVLNYCCVFNGDKQRHYFCTSFFV